MARYAIVDISNLFQRARHVTIGDAYTKAGMSMLIVLRSLRLLHREFKVDHMVFATDQGSWRYEVYPAYKAERVLARRMATDQEKEDNEVFFSALESFCDFMSEHTRCTVLGAPKIEADDFVARWVFLHPRDEHFIVSSDSDFTQLIAPNVHLYDGVQGRMLRTSGVANDKGETMAFSIEPGSGKVRVLQPDPGFVPEDDWWRKALFVKLVRGDPGDGVFSCYPRVSFKPTRKDISIQQAWEDRNDRGYFWNNMMQQEWSKLVGADENGEPVTKMVRVLDEYRINESLIDLTMQPDNVKARMDKAVAAAVEQDNPANVGVHFLRFCRKYALESLAREAGDHVAYLNLPYPPRVTGARTP